MKLKEYQERALKEVKNFLEQLVIWRERARANPDLEVDFVAKAWEKAEVGDGAEGPRPSVSPAFRYGIGRKDDNPGEDGRIHASRR